MFYFFLEHVFYEYLRISKIKFSITELLKINRIKLGTLWWIYGFMAIDSATIDDSVMIFNAF